ASHDDRPLVIVAGAGTGKTRTLTARVAALLDRGVAPQRILLLTFTRRAADDMVARATALCPVRTTERPHGGTFHAVAHRDVATYAQLLGLPEGFGILDAAATADLMDLLRDEHGLVGTEARFPRSAVLADLYSRCVNNDRRLRELVPIEYPWVEPHLDAVAELFAHYTVRKQATGVLDFDDLLLHWRALLADPAVGPALAERYSHVLVDEYQDVNRLQADIVALLAPGGRGLTAVGDEAQCIYGFRGSDPAHLRRLVSSFPDATVVRLETNFRSRQPILDVANAARPAADADVALQLRSVRGDGPTPTLLRCHDASSEARALVSRVLAAHESGRQLRDQAVLVRAAHHSDLVELELTHRRVPFRKYGGLRFLEAAHVKDFVAAARLIENPADELAWYRVLRLHGQIGPARAKSLLRGAKGSAGSDPLTRWPELVAEAPPAARTQLSATLCGLCEARQHTAPGRRAEALVRVVSPLVEARYDEAPARVGDLERLAAAAGAIDDWMAWLAELTFDPPASTGALAGEPHTDEDFVVISTIHSAKGLEWPVVHLPQLVDGFVPIDMALGTPDGLDEERRLFYVALTRAKDELHLYAPLRLHHHRFGRSDRHSYAPLSRFLDGQLLSTLEVEEEPRRRPGGDRVPADRRVTVDLGPLWR
ncbi:MAG: ATP-dependent helicase, partial [Acidimicrobiales bacterium]|nr:ATP-dependent helicase [Acidimicrobiales bacterium]